MRRVLVTWEVAQGKGTNRAIIFLATHIVPAPPKLIVTTVGSWGKERTLSGFTFVHRFAVRLE